ncbi:MAG: chorismate mutase [Bacteroidales bacterium]|jgi:chorismate mutase
MTELEKYRENIDRIDKQLIDLLKERFKYSEKIGKIKGDRGIPILQSGRWDEVMASRREYAIKAGLPEIFTADILQLIHRESIRIQHEVGNRNE